MKTYKVNKTNCHVYNADELPDDIQYNINWRKGKVGDWVQADDGKIVQILRRYNTSGMECIGTCTGTYVVSDDNEMDTVRKKDIYSVSGKNWYDRLVNRKEPTKYEVLFAQRLALGDQPTQAYLHVYKTKDEDTAKRKAAILVKQERIQKLVRQDLKDTFGKLGIDLDYLVESAKDVVDGAKNDSDRLKALNMLWDAFGVVETQKVTEVAGIFQGFSTEQIESVERKALSGTKKEIPESVK
tara:strand:- start:10194 stop:10916 length:723 start_codon:yes stop_codon:yes gene_type:complete